MAVPLFGILGNAHTDVAAPDVRPHLNTGTTLDIHVGKFLPGVGNSPDQSTTVLAGGLAQTNGISARPNNYKSSTMDAACVNAMSLMPDSALIKIETEGSTQRDRLHAMSIHGDIIKTHPVPLSSRMSVAMMSIEETEQFIDDVLIPKLAKSRKDRIVETPFIDPDTGKPIRMLCPTFLLIDAISSLESDAINEKAAKVGGVSEEGQNPLQMQLSNIKTRFVSKLNGIALEHGLILSITSQLTDKKIEDKYKPNPKELTYMQQNSYFHSAGKAFGRLMSNMIDNRAVAPLLNNDKDDTKYPTSPDRGRNAPKEFALLTRVVTRCKYHPAGHAFDQVISQTTGSDVPYLTAYETLHTNKQLVKSGNFFEIGMLPPDQKLSRTTVFDKGSDSYAVRRALELCYQHFVIKSTWTIPSTYPKAFMWDTRAVFDALMSGGYDMDTILESRGWWTYESEWAKKQRPYISLMDIMALASGEYTPKLSQVLFPWAIKKTV